MLACAAAARADLIVTGDRALLEFKTYRATRIVTIAQALELIHHE